MTMTNEKVSDIVKSILLRHFNIQPDFFAWEQPLEELQEDFKVLGNLVFLEQLLEKEFDKNIPILENISTSFHTPRDVVDLITNEI